MAYLAFEETPGGQPVRDPAISAPVMPAAIATAPAPVGVGVGTPVGFVADAPAPIAAPVSATARLSALEWSVVALAERDRLSTLRTPGRLSIAIRVLFGDTPNPRLADPQLEALRRVAVLSWHHGYTIPSAEVRAFLAAGYTPDQYELVVDSIGRGRAESNARRFRR